MRVIAGKFKRRNLVAPKGLTTRPPTDFIRENIFNILSYRVEDAKTLDLFAGSGSMGIEAISRDASACTFVEKDRNALASLKQNLSKLEISNITKIIPGDVFRAILQLAKKGEKFDLVLCDPPFDFAKDETKIESTNNLVKKIIAEILADENSLLVFRSKTRDVKLWPEKDAFDTRKYGDSTILFFEKNL